MGASGNGRYVLTAAWDEVEHATSDVVLHELKRGVSRPFRSHGERVQVAAIDSRGTTIVTGDTEGVVRVGLRAGGEPRLLLGHTTPIYSVAVSPDGAWVAAASGDRPIRLWSMPDTAKAPLHALPYEELLARLRTLTNLSAIADEASPGAHKIEIGPFPGWKDVPTW